MGARDMVTADLIDLERAFAARGHGLWFVGGCVRDSIIGAVPKDIDLATDATPAEAMEIYHAEEVRYHETGLSHGTLMVVPGDVAYEITTFRTDVDTDGRHAIVEYTRDLLKDLGRRDLTMNAIAMGLDGRIIDPFGGMENAKKGVVRFVGDPSARIREDYLRIMRWFRFLGRFKHDWTIPPDTATVAAIARGAEGMRRISVERVWSEMARIITGPNAREVLHLMRATGVAAAIDLPNDVGDDIALERAGRAGLSPATALGAYLYDGPDHDAVHALDTICSRWKLSNEERRDARFTASHRHPASGGEYGVDEARADLVDGHPAHLVSASLALRGQTEEAQSIYDWPIPVLPVTGDDLRAMGHHPGPVLGEALRGLRSAWKASGYTLTREALLQAVPAV